MKNCARWLTGEGRTLGADDQSGRSQVGEVAETSRGSKREGEMNEFRREHWWRIGQVVLVVGG